MKGIGTDIVEIERINHHCKQECFLKKVFTEKEISYAKRRKDVSSHLATSFAAKEAIFKALGTGWIEGKDIEILRDRSGKPRAVIKGELNKVVRSRDIMLSLSYTGSYAVAFAVIK